MILTQSMLRHLFDNATDGIVIVDPSDGRFLEANTNAYSRLGYGKDEFLCMRVADIHDDLGESEIKGVFEKQILGKQLCIETLHRRKDGTYMPVEITSTLIQLDNKQVLQSFIRDISERKKAEKEREDLISRIEKALSEIKTLQGILPLCSFCKKIRDDKGYWERVDVYIKENTEAEVSHSLCPECAREHYPDFLGDEE